MNRDDCEHRFEFTSDKAVLAAVAGELDWPPDADVQLSEVERCARCGKLNRGAWVGPGAGFIPGWLLERARPQ